HSGAAHFFAFPCRPFAATRRLPAWIIIGWLERSTAFQGPWRICWRRHAGAVTTNRDTLIYHREDDTMSEAEEFVQFRERLRRGDAEAAAELWRRYEPAIRLEIRCHLNPVLRRRFDSEDVRQDVFKTFFIHFQLGQYDFAEPADLVKLLREIARNKLHMRQRKELAKKRHPGKEEPVPEEWEPPAG